MYRRRRIVHVFLALLLLLTQQLGVTHVYSHWSGVEQLSAQALAQLSEADQAEHRKRIAVDKVCAECMSAAQMEAAITSTPLTLALSTLGTGPVTLQFTLPACERTVCVFQSRAPPVA